MKTQTKLLLVLTAIILANTASAGHVCPMQGCYPTQVTQSSAHSPTIDKVDLSKLLPHLLARARSRIKLAWQKIKAKLGDQGDPTFTPSFYNPREQRHPKVEFPIDPNNLPIIERYLP